MVGCILVYRFPFALSVKRLANAANTSTSSASTSRISLSHAPSSGTLAEFLSTSKQGYLQSLREGKGSDWIVVMGNEAGDLDTLVSSIAYAYFSGNNTVALQQTPRADLRLRPENMYALERSSLGTGDSLLCIDDLPADIPYPPPGSKFALVDHNSLNARFNVTPPATPVQVVGIIDHHDDDHAYMDAPLRDIQVPTGSCASLVANHFRSASQTSPSTSQLPPELASLLLSAILIDTDGLKEGGKAEPADHEAAAYLLPLATAKQEPAQLASDVAVLELTRVLNEKKFAVESLGARDLLRRDYKEYTIARGSQQVKVGLATVPLSLQRIFELSSERGVTGNEQPAEFWSGLDGWLEERSLDAVLVLCSFHAPKKSKEGKGKGADTHKATKTGKPAGKHNRQILVVVRGGESLKEVADDLFAGLETATELENEEVNVAELLASKKKKGKGKQFGEIRPNGSRVRAYNQKNADPSRKVIAPLIKSIISGPNAATST
ncbi:DHH phosphoesterase [Auriculariales sp. MPI-PUGE-AT-0066]|nr:DHH phosphoesterase [Auriculariales sp. MPI-PUGE-AT-0066]